MRKAELAQRQAAELAQLKPCVSLVDYALSLGFERVPDKSTKAVTFMRRDSDKIIVRRGDCGYDIYAAVGDSEKGSIVDFLQRREGLTLDQIRLRLLDWTGSHEAPKPSSPSSPSSSTTKPDRAKVRRIWNVLDRVQAPPYLLSRKIPRSTLMDARFADCWRQGRDGVVSPSWDTKGLCGLEFRGEGVKRFLSRESGGVKGLWASRNVKTCSRLVVCEGVINALSYHALYADSADWEWPLGYAAFGGGLGSLQRELLAGLFRQAVERGCEIVAATDNDSAGDRYVETLAALAGIAIERVCPYGEDFNEDLCWCVREEGQSWN